MSSTTRQPRNRRYMRENSKQGIFPGRSCLGLRTDACIPAKKCLVLFTQPIQHTPSVDFPWGGNASVFRLNFEPRGLHTQGARGGAVFGYPPGEAHLSRLPHFSSIAHGYLIPSLELRESKQPSGAQVHVIVQCTICPECTTLSRDTTTVFIRH